jgi:peptide/nickel transport system substrate-binding protein
VSFNVKSGCLIATATYGSELSPEVQFLREFRDNMVLKTFAGSSFMTVFNAWYYSFSPTVASTVSRSEVLRGVMRVTLYPLMGILHLGSSTFSLFNFNPELGVVVAGLVASSLIGLIYFMPWVLLFSLLRKFKLSPKMVSSSALVWAGSIVAIVLAEVIASSSLMMASTGVFVLATICLTILGALRAMTKRYIP